MRFEARRHAAVCVERGRGEAVGLKPAVETLKRYPERVAVKRRARGGVRIGVDGVAQIVFGELQTDHLLHVRSAGQRAAQIEQTGGAMGVADLLGAAGQADGAIASEFGGFPFAAGDSACKAAGADEVGAVGRQRRGRVGVVTSASCDRPRIGARLV